MSNSILGVETIITFISKCDDGVIEGENQSGEDWKVQGLLNAAASRTRQGENAEQIVRSIFNSMDGFTEGRQTDDATLAGLRVL